MGILSSLPIFCDRRLNCMDYVKELFAFWNPVAFIQWGFPAWDQMKRGWVRIFQAWFSLYKVTLGWLCSLCFALPLSVVCLNDSTLIGPKNDDISTPPVWVLALSVAVPMQHVQNFIVSLLVHKASSEYPVLSLLPPSGIGTDTYLSTGALGSRISKWNSGIGMFICAMCK